jgi:DNA-directed RNA polymerase specialized sigma24 family protein
MVKVTHCPTFEKPVPGEPTISNCPDCKNWGNGKGLKQCLKCSTYKNYCIKSTPRPKITVEILPAAIMVELADTSDDMPSVLTAIQHLPDDLALIITSRYVAGLPAKSVAGLLRTSERQIYRRESIALSEIKKILRKENNTLR